MIIDDGREINITEDVPFKVGGVYKESNGNNYYILMVDWRDENYYNLTDLERGIGHYDDSLDRCEMQEGLNNSFEYVPNAKLSF